MQKTIFDLSSTGAATSAILNKKIQKPTSTTKSEDSNKKLEVGKGQKISKDIQSNTRNTSNTSGQNLISRTYRLKTDQIDALDNIANWVGMDTVEVLRSMIDYGINEIKKEHPEFLNKKKNPEILKV